MNDNIQDIGESEFQDKVITGSNSALILVDFWAPWCGPCKQLTPILEKITNKANGKVKLIKINIDDNQQIAGQLKIQSIPAVFAFKDGKPIDAFQGVIPEKKIIEFIEKHLGEKLIEDFKDFYNNIALLISENKFEEIKEALEVFLSENPDEVKSFALYIDCLNNLNLFNEADIFIESLDEKILKDNLVISSIKKLKITKKKLKGPSIENLIDKIKENPNKINLFLELADKYFANNLYDEAFDILLKNYVKNKDIIKKKFLEYFEALGAENPKTVEYRKKFSSIMFS
jgi:putative thioredoxin